MDPLSAAASVAGLLSAANQITKTLSSLADAPRLARSVIGETEALAAIFSQLNGFLRGTMHPKRERMSMTTVDQFVAVLTNCVLTFAELEEELDSLGLEDGDGMKLWDRMKWTAKQDTLREILADLQQQKASLNLMIGIWNCKTNMEAADKYEHLCVAINRILERGQNQRASMNPDNTATKLEADAEFDHRQLRRSKRSFSMDRSRRSSVLSVISLDQVEDLASLPLPLYSCEIYNKSQYIFVKQHASVRTRVRPKSAGFSLGVLEPRQKSLVTKVASLWKLQTKGFDISGPFNARHNTHIGMDIMTGKMRVLGQETPETIAAKNVGWMT